MNRMIPASLLLAVATTLVAAAATSAAAQTIPTAQPSNPGDQSRWSLDFSARMEQTSARPIEVHMLGSWTSTIVATRAGDYDAQLQLADLQFTGDAMKSAPAAALKSMQDRLARPFWATYRNDGGLLAMHFYRDVSPSDRNLLQTIATELQLVRPDSSLQSWTAQERDGAGEYSALYVMPQPDRIVKRKLKYLYTDGVAGAPTDAVRISIEESDIEFSIAADHRVRGVDGINRVRMILSPDKSEQLDAVTEFHASHLQAGSAPQLAGSLERALTDVVDSPIVTQRPDAGVARAQADDRLLQGFTTETILDAAFAKTPGAAAQADRLTALFRSRPGTASDAAALLVKNGPRKTVTNALGAAGSPSAVAALGKLAHDAALPQDLRVDAILAFVQMQYPTAEAMRGPSDLVADSNAQVQSAARLIEGALARAGRAGHPAEAGAIDAALLALYGNSHDTREKAELLGALGNSAGPAAIQTVEEALHDNAPPIRAAAARALRLASGADADRLLASAIVDDRDASVRADAIFATRFRHPLPTPLAEALLQAASADQASYVRSDALAVIRQNLTASERIPETLAHIANSDSDSGIRRQASDALAAITNPPSTHP